MTKSLPKIRVLLADDHTIVRKGIRLLLDAEPSLVVVGEAEIHLRLLIVAGRAGARQ